jgi:MFS family permease
MPLAEIKMAPLLMAFRRMDSSTVLTEWIFLSSKRLAALAPTFTWFLVALVPVGLTAMTFNAAAKTLLQLAAEPQLRGRVMALWQIAWQGSALVGGPLIGWIGAQVGPRWGLLTGGVAALVAGAIWLPKSRHATGVLPRVQIEPVADTAHAESSTAGDEAPIRA